MRKRDREIQDINKIIKILKDSDRLVLAFNGVEYPYMLPVNAGVERLDETIVLYFHGAKEGKKYDYLMDGVKVSFEADTDLELVTDFKKGYCTMNYSSVIGWGEVQEIKDYEDKERALQVIVDSYHIDDGFVYNRGALDRTAVFKIIVKEIRGKTK